MQENFYGVGVDPFLKSLGNKIKGLRESKGLSRVELGKLAGTSYVSIGSIEEAKSSTNVLLLRRIASALDTTPERLITDEPLSESPSILEAIKGLNRAAENTLWETKRKADEIRASKDKYTAEEYKEQLETLEEIRGRIGIFRVFVADCARHFMFIRPEIHEGKARPPSGIFKMLVEKYMGGASDAEKRRVLDPDSLNIPPPITPQESLLTTVPTLDDAEAEQVLAFAEDIKATRPASAGVTAGKPKDRQVTKKPRKP